MQCRIGERPGRRSRVWQVFDKGQMEDGGTMRQNDSEWGPKHSPLFSRLNSCRAENSSGPHLGRISNLRKPSSGWSLGKQSDSRKYFAARA
jgi:hypothetical protein